MTNFADLFATAWRNWNTPGAPESGDYEPEKAVIRGIGSALDAAFEIFLLAATQAGAEVYATKAEIDARLSDSPPPELGTVGVVLADDNSPPENGWYRVTSGPAWTKFADLFDGQSVVDYVDAQIADEAAARIAADADLDARVTVNEADIADIQENAANSNTAARAVDGLGILAGVYRNHSTGATLNKAIDTSGTLVSATGRYATDYIEVTSTTAITRFGSPVTSGSYVPFAFYDSAKVFLGYSWTGADLVTIYDLASAPAGTKYVRLTATNSTIEYYIYEPAMVRLLKDFLFSLYALPIDNAGNLAAQYVNKTTGVIGSSSSYRMTGALPVTAESYIACGGGLISSTNSTQCQIAFFDVGGSPEYLGYYNPVAVNQLVKVGDLFPSATSVRVTFKVAEVGPVHVINTGDGLDRVMDMVANGAIVDYFAPELVDAERLNLTGGTTQSGHAYWRTTDYIAVVEGQVFYVSAQDVTSLGAVIAGFDADQFWSSNLLVGATNADYLNYRVVIPADIAYIRATYRNDIAPFGLYSVRPAQALQEGGAADVVYLAPDEAYGRVGEPVYLFARGVVGDRSVSVGWAPASGTFDTFQGAEKLRITKDDDGAAAVKVRATAGSSWVDISTLDLRLSATTGSPAVTSPAAHINIVVIGDSTTSQLSSGDPDATDGDGTWVNEMSRQLTGIGDQALDDSPQSGDEWGAVVAADIRPALSLTNIHFRGTRGTGTIKHEGRGGWHPISYLERTDAVGGDGKSNAFWDPGLTPWGPGGTTWQFSMKYYIENNGWDIGTVASGVEADGSNLLVIIALGWNDYGNDTEAGVSAGYMGYLLDQINAEYPGATVWVTSLWAPPAVTFKGNTATSVEKFYSAAEIFRSAVRDYGVKYRKICQDRSTYARFIQVSHQMDPDYCFSKSTFAPNPVANDSSLIISGTGDFVHMRRRGYAMLGSVMGDAFLYHYCRGV